MNEYNTDELTFELNGYGRYDCNIGNIQIRLSNKDNVSVEYPNGVQEKYQIHIKSKYINDGQCHWNVDEFYITKNINGVPIDIDIVYLNNMGCKITLIYKHKESERQTMEMGRDGCLSYTNSI